MAGTHLELSKKQYQPVQVRSQERRQGTFLMHDITNSHLLSNELNSLPLQICRDPSHKIQVTFSGNFIKKTSVGDSFGVLANQILSGNFGRHFPQFFHSCVSHYRTWHGRSDAMDGSRKVSHAAVSFICSFIWIRVASGCARSISPSIHGNSRRRRP